MYRGLGESREFGPVTCPAWCDLGAHEQFQHQTTCPEHPSHRIQQRVGSDERRLCRLPSRSRAVAERDGLDGDTAGDGCLEQRGPEPA